jgi:hypothetical protein
MSDQPTGPADDNGAPDAVVTDALRSLTPPPHRFGFWAEVEDGMRDQAAPTEAVPVAPPPPPPAAPFPPLAEVVPLPPPPGRTFPRWLAAAAAAVVVVAALGAALVSRTSGTDVETTSPPESLAMETTALPTTTLPPAPTTTAPVVTAPVTTPKPTVAPTTTAPPTTARSPLTATPDGLGPLRIGMTIAQTTATGAMGPFDDALDTGGACGYAKPAGTTYRAEDFDAIFLEGKLARLYFRDTSRVRTPEGIGVGSASSKLSGVAGARTESPHAYQLGTNVDIMRGNVGYQFTIDKGKVVEWSIGTAEGLSLTEGCA